MSTSLDPSSALIMTELSSSVTTEGSVLDAIGPPWRVIVPRLLVDFESRVRGESWLLDSFCPPDSIAFFPSTVSDLFFLCAHVGPALRDLVVDGGDCLWWVRGRGMVKFLPPDGRVDATPTVVVVVEAEAAEDAVDVETPVP